MLKLKIVVKGTVLDLRRALPPEGPQRKAAVRQREEKTCTSLLDQACGQGHF